MPGQDSWPSLANSDDDTLRALHHILGAWETGTDDGIAPELMAYAALYAALTDLVATYGEEHVGRLVDTLKPRLDKGEFTLYRSKQ